MTGRPAPGGVHVVSDTHGHPQELRAALHRAGLVDAAGDWSGGAATLWFLGDFFDRGPDGIGAVDLVRSLQEQAPAQGGSVNALLGNHEILALGMHRFGHEVLPAADGRPRSFALSWTLNGGRASDQERLTQERLAWLLDLPAVAREGEWLLAHADTLDYLHWGDSVDAVNATVHQAMRSDDLGRWWELWRRLTTRHAFVGPDGRPAASRLLEALGGERLVHGHSIIGNLTGQDPADVREPLLYAGGLALDVDGGLYDGGPCLVVRLDEVPPPAG